jgi:hypothetical protein
MRNAIAAESVTIPVPDGEIGADLLTTEEESVDIHTRQYRCELV